MKNIFFAPRIFIFLIIMTLVSCGKDKPLHNEKQDVSIAHDGAAYILDTLNSKIEWKGYKVVKFENTSHFGTIKFESGDITLKNGKLESGKFTAKMASLENVDLKDDTVQKAKLENHLKSGDFFEVEKFPTATYQITKVSESNNNSDYNTVLEGNLTIKNITKPIKFNANVSVKDGSVSIATEPTDINREDFGIKFQMPVENGLIKDDINIQILIKASEKK